MYGKLHTFLKIISTHLVDYGKTHNKTQTFIIYQTQLMSSQTHYGWYFFWI